MVWGLQLVVWGIKFRVQDLWFLFLSKRNYCIRLLLWPELTNDPAHRRRGESRTYSGEKEIRMPGEKTTLFLDLWPQSALVYLACVM